MPERRERPPRALPSPSHRVLARKGRLPESPAQGGLPWRLAAESWLSSRALYVLTIYLLATMAVPVFGRHVPHSKLSDLQLFLHYLRVSLFNSDGHWYYTIALHGYSRKRLNLHQTRNWAFFPLYPYLTRWLGGAIGIKRAGYVLSGLSFLGFLMVLDRWVSVHQGGEVARLAVLLAAFNPLTPYFVAYRAASLFIFLSAGTLAAIDLGAWALALPLGALASLTRPLGILLSVPYIVALSVRTGLPKGTRLAWLAGVMAFGIGPAIVAYLVGQSSGNPFAFILVQRAWGRRLEFPFLSTFHWFLRPKLTTPGGWGFPSLSILLSIAGLCLAVWMVVRGRDLWPAALYLLVTVVVVNASNSFMGIPRFIIEVPSVFLGTALLANRFEAQNAFLIGDAGLMVLYCALWILGVHAVHP